MLYFDLPYFLSLHVLRYLWLQDCVLTNKLDRYCVNAVTDHLHRAELPTSIPGPFLKLGKGKGPGIGWSHDTQNIWV